MTLSKQRLAEIKARAEAATLMPSHRSLDERFIAHAIVDIPDLVAEVEELNRQRIEAYQHVETLFLENKRLRGLLKAGEFTDTGYYSGCLTCNWCRVENIEGHSPDCPAFTPEGEVR